jgi:hypothetical protein
LVIPITVNGNVGIKAKIICPNCHVSVLPELYLNSEVTSRVQTIEGTVGVERSSHVRNSPTI